MQTAIRVKIADVVRVCAARPGRERYYIVRFEFRQIVAVLSEEVAREDKYVIFASAVALVAVIGGEIGRKRKKIAFVVLLYIAFVEVNAERGNAPIVFVVHVKLFLLVERVGSDCKYAALLLA